MKKIVQIPRKNLHSDSFQETMPASKRTKTGHSSNYSIEEDDEDPFAEDLITGEEFEEWERVATQAEIKLTQEQSDDRRDINHYDDHLEHNGGTKFKLPSSTTNSRGSKMSHDKNSFLINELQAKLKLYENKMKEMEQSYLRKDGETRVLRDRLTRAEKNLCEEKVKYSELQKQQLDADKNQQKYIEKQVEKYKDQIEFKQAEILESQNLIKNLEMKNKQLLENTSALNSTSSSKPPNSNFPECSNWGSTQGGPSSAKKIKLVKPESPRVQSNVSFNNVTFTDDPLGRKKSKLMTTTPASVAEVVETKSTKDEHRNCNESVKLKSKYISNGLNNHSILQCLFGTKINTTGEAAKVTSPILHLLEPTGKDRCPDISETMAIEGITKLLRAPNQDLKAFEHLVHSDIHHLNSAIDVLPIIEKAISTYVSLQEHLSTFVTSQEESSFQTAASKPEDLPPHPVIASSSLTPEKICSICERILSAVKVLEVLSSHSRKIIDSIFQNFPGMLKNMMTLCTCRKWNNGLFFTQSITACILSIIRILLEAGGTEEHYQNFTPLMKAENWVSLISCTDIPVRCSTLDALIAYVHFKPFALVVIENQNPESSSLLCHICDACCSCCPPDVPEKDWILLQKKNVAFLSLLAAKHELLLMEHLCFSEIYRAADVLLYNQLLRWKNSILVDQSRDNLIHSTVCLLHSCANVYADGIPGSRRDHRHQVVLIELENFLNYNRDNESFWLQELNRIVKAEVKSVLEEQEAT